MRPSFVFYWLLVPILLSVAIREAGAENLSGAPQKKVPKIGASTRPSPDVLKGAGIQGLESPKQRKLGGKIIRRGIAGVPSKKWILGPELTFDGPLGKVRSGSSVSKGLGFGVGLSLKYQWPEFRVAFVPSYRSLKLGREIDGSGILFDPSPVTITQTIQYVGTGAWFSFLIEDGAMTATGREPAWWTELGTELLIPLSGKQTSSASEELKIKAQKLWLILLGGSVDYEFQTNNYLRAGFHIFYNLPGNAEGRLFGARAQIAFDFGLL